MMRGAATLEWPTTRPFSLARWFLISPGEALFERRGFVRTPAAARLERAAGAFIAGHNEVAQGRSTTAVMMALAGLPFAERGFYAEGAAMGAAISTICLPWRDPLSPLLAALETDYAHLAHVGVGWAMARLPFARHRLARRLDPMLAPLAIDGRGFHDGYFRSAAVAAGRRRIKGAWGRVYDQGVGRSLWFSRGADPAGIAAVIAGLGADRSDDLWAGVGLAAVYAGGAGPSDVEKLIGAAGASSRWLRQGAAFAIGAHARAGQVPEEAARTALLICGERPDTLTRLVDAAFLEARQRDMPQPARYQSWRRDVADMLARKTAT